MVYKIDNTFNLHIERFDYYKLQGSFTPFNISQDTVIFFHSGDNHVLTDYLQSNLADLEQLFKSQNKSLIDLISKKENLNISNILDFFVPIVNQNEREIIDSTINSIVPAPNDLLNYLEYGGNIKTGIVFFQHYEAFIIGLHDYQTERDVEDVFKNIVKYFQYKTLSQVDDYDDLPSNIFNPYKDVDEETLKKINEIKVQLNDLKQCGQYLSILPLLKEMLISEVQSLKKSSLVVDQEYRILLPEFNNLEIHLSHLTKSIYLLFLNHPKGINIKELNKHRDELLALYAKITYQMDYDKIKRSIDELVQPNSNAIYAHISRIKSAFLKKMDYEIAKHYIVTSDRFGSDLKCIEFLNEM